MKTVLVTGGAGFIGSNLSKTLIEKGFSVRILDSLITGKKGNLSGLEGAEMIEGDMRNMETVRKAVEGAHCIFHQAALPSVPRSVKDPVLSNDINIGGTLNMLVAAAEAGVRKFVYAASSSAYGESEKLPKVETMIPAPMSPYAVSKLAGEYYCQVFHKIHGIEAVSLRYFNVFGPNQDPTSQYSAVIPKFITSMMRGERPTIYGDGTQTRDFTFVEDVVHANILAMENSDKAAGKTVNISRGERISINRLVDMLNDIMGTSIEAEHLDERKGDIKHSLADISLAGKLLSYSPKFTLKDGLKKTVEFYGSKQKA